MVGLVTCTWDDVPHISEEMKEQQRRGMKPHEREAREKGVPSLGSGAIYPIEEDFYTVEMDPRELAAHMPRAYGLDVGWKATAAIWAAWERTDDIVYVYSDYKRGHAEPEIHAAAIRARGNWMLGAIDPASRGRSQRDGKRLIDDYRHHGLQIMEAENAVEAGIFEVWTRLSEGRLKILKTCVATLAEMRLYRRDEHGKVVKQHDHLMDALRYLVMMLAEVMSLPMARHQTQRSIRSIRRR